MGLSFMGAYTSAARIVAGCRSEFVRLWLMALIRLRHTQDSYTYAKKRQRRGPACPGTQPGAAQEGWCQITPQRPCTQPGSPHRCRTDGRTPRRHCSCSWPPVFLERMPRIPKHMLQTTARMIPRVVGAWAAREERAAPAMTGTSMSPLRMEGRVKRGRKSATRRRVTAGSAARRTITRDTCMAPCATLPAVSHGWTQHGQHGRDFDVAWLRGRDC